MKRYLLFIALISLLVSCAATIPTTSKNQSMSYIIGSWKIYETVPNASFKDYNSEFIFNTDGTLIEKNDDPDTPGSIKWEAVSENIVLLTNGGKQSYIMIEDYKMAYNQSKKSRFLNGNFILYPDNSPYNNYLKVFYFAPGKMVDKLLKRRISLYHAVNKSVRSGVVAVKEYDKLISVFNEEQKRIEEVNKAAQKQYKKKMKMLTKKWGKRVARAIANEKVFVGMTKKQVIVSIGEPIRKNTVKNKRGTFEQWVYHDDKYLYFRNKKLRSIQKFGN